VAKDAPPKRIKLAHGSYYFAALIGFLVAAVMIWNNLRFTDVAVPEAAGLTLMPPGPWKLGMRSNAWDFGLLSIVLIAQIFVGLVISFPERMRNLLPEPEKLDRVAYVNVMVSFALVAVVLVTGALWAHYAWGRYWGWDPKETGALVIWINYALYLHTRVTYGWAGPKAAVIGIIGFFVILAGFLGVNLGWFADGLHSYGAA
jgi:cytochrome c-type biogenesis protein CcsB